MPSGRSDPFDPSEWPVPSDQSDQSDQSDHSEWPEQSDQSEPSERPEPPDPSPGRARGALAEALAKKGMNGIIRANVYRGSSGVTGLRGRNHAEGLEPSDAPPTA
ncbi:hypothetical protein GCM10018952_58720 [Streptosporangium vulgare]